MWTVIECAGHPRDMGLAQGEAVRAGVAAACDAAGLSTRRSRRPTLSGFSAGPVRGAGAGREFIRHFAHQAERLEGLARAAGVPIDSILALHLQGGAEPGLLAQRAGLRAYPAPSTHDIDSHNAASKGRILLERSLPACRTGEAGWLLRESRPAVGFRSVEVGLPWLVPGVAGVNEAGLAVMASPLLWSEAGQTSAPPLQLLVQECLQRFEDLDGALGWCEKRPAEGEQSLVLADASGAVATVISSGRARRIQVGTGELLLEGGEPGASEVKEAQGESAGDRVLLDARGRCLRLEAKHATIELRLD